MIPPGNATRARNVAPHKTVNQSHVRMMLTDIQRMQIPFIKEKADATIRDAAMPSIDEGVKPVGAVIVAHSFPNFSRIMASAL